MPLFSTKSKAKPSQNENLVQDFRTVAATTNSSAGLHHNLNNTEERRQVWSRNFEDKVSMLDTELQAKFCSQHAVTNSNHSFMVKLNYLQKEAEDLGKLVEDQKKTGDLLLQETQRETYQLLRKLDEKLDALNLENWPDGTKLRDEIQKAISLLRKDIQTFMDTPRSRFDSIPTEFSPQNYSQTTTTAWGPTTSQQKIERGLEYVTILSVSGSQINCWSRDIDQLHCILSSASSPSASPQVVLVTLIHKIFLEQSSKRPTKMQLRVFPHIFGHLSACPFIVVQLVAVEAAKEPKNNPGVIPHKISNFYINLLFNISKTVIKIQDADDIPFRSRDSSFNDLPSSLSFELNRKVTTIFSASRHHDNINFNKLLPNLYNNSSRSLDTPIALDTLLKILTSACAVNPNDEDDSLKIASDKALAKYYQIRNEALQKKFYNKDELDDFHANVADSITTSFLHQHGFEYAPYTVAWQQQCVNLKKTIELDLPEAHKLNQENVDEAERLRSKAKIEYQFFLENIYLQNQTQFQFQNAVVPYGTDNLNHQAKMDEIIETLANTSSTALQLLPESWKLTVMKELESTREKHINRLGLNLRDADEVPQIPSINYPNYSQTSVTRAKVKPQTIWSYSPVAGGSQILGQMANFGVPALSQTPYQTQVIPASHEPSIFSHGHAVSSPGQVPMSSRSSSNEPQTSNLDDEITNLVLTLRDAQAKLEDPGRLISVIDEAMHSTEDENEANMTMSLKKLKRWADKLDIKY